MHNWGSSLINLWLSYIQKAAQGEVDRYAEVVDMVTRFAPPISIPWLTSDPEAARGPSKSTYCELNVKKMITGAKTKEDGKNL